MAVAFNRNLADRLRDFIGLAEAPRAGDLGGGMFRLGSLGSFQGQAWYYQRIINAVYTNPTGKRCVDAISSAFARPPLKCYKPGDEMRETPKSSPLQALLNNPVPQGLKVQAVSGKMAARKRARDLTLAGMSVTLKIRGQTLTDGPITQLRRLPPQRVTVIGNHHDELLGFIYHDRLGGRMPLLPTWTVYERFSHPERDYQPFPPALAAGLGGESDNRAARFALDLLENDGAVPAVVMLEGLTPDLFGEWVARWQAVDDPGKVRFMGFTGTPGGGKSAEVVKIGQTNAELAHNTLRQMSQEDIGRALGCPPVVAYQLSHETYANAETEEKIWYATTLRDYWDQSADEMTAQLGYEYGVELGYDVSLIEQMQESKDTMVDRHLKLQDHQNVTINDTNERLGLPDVPWGDEPLTPTMAMQPEPAPPATIPGQEPPPAPPAPPTPSTPAPPGAPASPATPAPAPAGKSALPAFRREGSSLAITPLSPAGATASDRVQRRLERFCAHQGRAIAKRLTAPNRDRSAAAMLRRGWFDVARWDDELAEELLDLEVADYAAAARGFNVTTHTELAGLLGTAADAGRTVPDLAQLVTEYFERRGAERAAGFQKEN